MTVDSTKIRLKKSPKMHFWLFFLFCLGTFGALFERDSLGNFWLGVIWFVGCGVFSSQNGDLGWRFTGYFMALSCRSFLHVHYLHRESLWHPQIRKQRALKRVGSSLRFRGENITLKIMNFYHNCRHFQDFKTWHFNEWDEIPFFQCQKWTWTVIEIADAHEYPFLDFLNAFFLSLPP